MVLQGSLPASFSFLLLHQSTESEAQITLMFFMKASQVRWQHMLVLVRPSHAMTVQ